MYKKSSGFHTFSLELEKHLKEIDGKRLYSALQQTFSLAADSKADKLTEEYIKYKKRYAKNLRFNPDIQNLSNISISSYIVIQLCKSNSHPAAVIEHTPLQSVYIYFDTATYDQIERDIKVILKAASEGLIKRMKRVFSSLIWLMYQIELIDWHKNLVHPQCNDYDQGCDGLIVYA